VLILCVVVVQLLRLRQVFLPYRLSSVGTGRLHRSNDIFALLQVNLSLRLEPWQWRCRVSSLFLRVARVIECVVTRCPVYHNLLFPMFLGRMMMLLRSVRTVAT
jgi:hypothetical protein